MRFTALMFVLILVITSSANAGEVQRIKLTDGSVLNAEVISMHNGVYTFKSPSLGEFSVNSNLVQSISASNAATPQAGSGNMNLDQIQSKLKAKPETMKLISGLQNDPDMQAVLSDPKIMDALKNGDYDAVSKNPKFQKLMKNPTVKQITSGVSQ